MSIKGPGVKLGAGADGADEEESGTVVRVSEDDKIEFAVMYSYLKDVLNKSGLRLYLLLDEWSSLPREIQPYLAEFFKRTFLPNPDVVIKIGSLEYRSSFGKRQASGDILGFELGSDIPVTLDVDEYYVYDRNPYDATNQFGEVLYKHILSELPRNYLQSTFTIVSAGKLVDKLFATLPTFEELARASEGVARDLINIFTRAYFDARRRGKDDIDKSAVTEAARRWFEQDKEQNLDDPLREVLQRIVGEVIGHQKARSFLIVRELEKNSTLQGLFEARVLHRIYRGYFDKDNPTVKYNVYTLDYGTYVDLLDTKNSPAGFFIFDEFLPPPDTIVPFNDNRSIKRILLPEDILKPTAPALT